MKNPPLFLLSFIKEPISHQTTLIASKDYIDTIELADYVRDALEGRRGNFAGVEINDIRMISADEEYIEDTFIQNLTFDINTNGKQNT